MKLDNIEITHCQLINSTRTARIYRSNAYAIKCLAQDYNIPPHNSEFELSILHKIGNKSQHILPLLESKSTVTDLLLLFPFEEMNLHEFMQSQYRKDRKKNNPYYNLLNPIAQNAATSPVETYTNHLDVSQYSLSFFWQLVEGVAFLHDNKVIHRDIKPQNIMLTNKKTTTPPQLYIIDFGISYDMENKSQTKAEPMDNKVTDISTGIYLSLIHI